MTREELREALCGFKETKARLEALKPQAEEMLRQINRAAMEAAPEMAYRGVDYSGQHGGSGVSSPVQDAVIRAMEGEVPEQLRLWMRESEELQEEIQRLDCQVRRMEAALSALNQRERIVVEQHMIEDVSWRALVSQSHRLLGEHYSEGTLRSIQQRALDKMLGVLA